MPQPVKQCLGCSYILDRLEEQRCPECGRPFDPADLRTFKIGGIKRARWNVFVVPSPWHGLLLILPPIIALLIALLVPYLCRCSAPG